MKNDLPDASACGNLPRKKCRTALNAADVFCPMHFSGQDGTRAVPSILLEPGGTNRCLSRALALPLLVRASCHRWSRRF